MSQSSLFGTPTYRVSQLAEEIKLFLTEAFPSIWVIGEIQRLRRSQRGHVYFELVEKGSGDQIVGRLEAVLWRGNAQRVREQLGSSDQALTEGAEIRCRARVDFYPPAGRLQISVEEVDPMFSLGRLELRRRETLAALAAADLLHRNQERVLSTLPLRVGLVTSHGSAAYHDFLATLKESPYGFDLLLVHASVQGGTAEREVSSALHFLARQSLDVTVLIRGGGSRSDLAAFDSRRIAEAVARHPFPVLTGLGHEIDRSVSDQVAHTAVKTPTGAAEFLVRRVERSEAELAVIVGQITALALKTVQSGGVALRQAQLRLASIGFRTQRESNRLRELTRLLDLVVRQRVLGAVQQLEGLRNRVLREAPRRASSGERRRLEMGRRLVRSATQRLEQSSRDVEARERLRRQLAPERILERGFSITRSSEGRLLREASELSVGDEMVTTLPVGTLRSRVEG